MGGAKTEIHRSKIYSQPMKTTLKRGGFRLEARMKASINTYIEWVKEETIRLLPDLSSSTSRY